MSDAFVAGAAPIQPSTSKVAAAATGEDQPPKEQADCKADESSGNSEGSALPQLPAGDPNDTSVPVLKLGESMSFAEMGPVIINADGTTRQIANWDKMTKKEQEVTWRRISKRNQERRAKLEQQMRAAEEE